MHAADTFASEDGERDEYVVGRTRLVPSSVAFRGFRQDFNAKLFSVFSHAKFDLAEELNPEIYATVHASSSVLSAVEKPR